MLLPELPLEVQADGACDCFSARDSRKLAKLWFFRTSLFPWSNFSFLWKRFVIIQSNYQRMKKYKRTVWGVFPPFCSSPLSLPSLEKLESLYSSSSSRIESLSSLSSLLKELWLEIGDICSSSNGIVGKRKLLPAFSTSSSGKYKLTMEKLLYQSQIIERQRLDHCYKSKQ